VIELAYERARPLMSPAGGQVELAGWVQSDADVAKVVLATRAGAVIGAALEARNGGAPQRWRALISADSLSDGGAGIRVCAWDRSGRVAQVDVPDPSPLPSPQPWSEEEFRAGLAAGEPMLVCANPTFDGATVVDQTVLIEGWAWSPGGIESCSAQLDDESPVQGVTGIATPGLTELLGDYPGLELAGIRIVCPMDRTRSPLLVVQVRTREGLVLSWGTQVTVDPDLLYRRRLVSGEARAASLPEPAREPPRLEIWPLSHDAGRFGASLATQNYPWCSLASEAPDGGVMAGVRAAADAGEALTIFVDGDPELRAGALTAFAAAALENPDAGAFYADHDRRDERGERCDPWLKPVWSPEHLLAIDYLGPLLAVRSAAARAVLEDGVPVRGRYDLAVRLLALRIPVGHVGRIAASVPSDAPALDQDDARAAIEQLVLRRGSPVEIEPLDRLRRRVSWPRDDPPRVSVVIPTGGHDQMVHRCLRSIAERTTHRRLEIVIVNTSDGDLDLPTVDGVELSVIDVRGPFNFSTACNAGAERSSGEVLVFLNDDMEIETPDWIERLLDHALAPGVGPVAPKLLYPDRSIQHAGVVIRPPPAGAANLLRGMSEEDTDQARVASVARNLSAVSGACVMITRRAFDAIGGFDEKFPLEWGDVDLCLRAGAAGLRTVYTPHSVLIHYESQSRGMGTSPADLAVFHERWGEAFTDGDPYWPFGPGGELE
jgi:GT2 family glycosyltransferase